MTEVIVEADAQEEASLFAQRVRNPTCTSNSKHRHLLPGTKVSGMYGKLVQNPPGHGRQVCERLVGNIVKSLGLNEWQVKFDDGNIQTCKSNRLKIIPVTAGVPLTNDDDCDEEFESANVIDGKEDEHLPSCRDAMENMLIEEPDTTLLT